MMRIINISAGYLNDGDVDADKWQAFSTQCGGDKPIREALGYLSLWNWSTYPVVDITIMGEAPGSLELLAYYRTEPGGQAGYVIGAVWQGNRFSFHS